MIEQLNGIHETVLYTNDFPVKAYLNIETESYPMHWQTAIEIILPIDNNYTVNVEENIIDLEPGDVLFIAPGVLHSITAPLYGSRYIFQIDPRHFTELGGLERLTSTISPCLYFPVSSCRNVCSEILEYAGEIYREYSSSSPFNLASVYLYVLKILINAVRYGKDQTPAMYSVKTGASYGSQKYASKFIKICDYINEHCMENPSLEEMAALSGFSQPHFIRLFKQFTGITFYNYLNRCKITYAKNRLSTYPNLSINEVAAQSGFKSLTTFNRLFRSIVQCTPSDYRDNLKI